MLRALTGFLCLCFAVSAAAKLGETVPQLVKRFGKSYTVEEAQLGKTYKFRSANVSVDVVVSNGQSICETYFSDHALTASGEPPNDIVQAVLRTNAPKARWKEIEAAPLGADYATRSSDGEYIAILKYTGPQPENSVWTMTVGAAKTVHAVSAAAPPSNASSPTSTAAPAPSPFPTPSPSAPVAEREFPALTQHEAIQGAINAFMLILGLTTIVISILKGKWKTLTILLALAFILTVIGVKTGLEGLPNIIEWPFAICSIVFAIRLAKVGSFWERHFYSEEKSAKAVSRQSRLPFKTGITSVRERDAELHDKEVKMNNRVHESGESSYVSHQEFVSGMGTVRVSLTIDGPGAYPFAASRSNAFVWHITAWMQMLLTFPVVCVATIVLTIVLRDARILLAIPAAMYAPPGMSGLLSYRLPDVDFRDPNVRGIFGSQRVGNRVHQLVDIVAIIGACYTWFTFGWRSPWFLICAAYLVTFFECVIYHAVCRRAFYRMLVIDPTFYNEALAAGVIRVQRA
jgi:hypothetical protein